MATPVINKIIQIGIIVNDIEISIARYESYGIGPWEIEKADGSVLRNRKVKGINTKYEMITAFSKIGDIEIELIQPLDDLSDYAAFLKKHGEGIHHLAVQENSEAFKKTIKKRNIKELKSGYWRGFGSFFYFDTRRDLGFITEIYDYENTIV